MTTEKTMIKAFMPVTKNVNGKFMGILSDTSMDRDREFMGKEMIETWAVNGNVKALANHENKMQSWVGGWREMKTVSKGANTALMAEPWFFSKEANPLADQIKKQVEEALDRGENPGISVGVIPTASEMREIDGKKYKVYTEGELVEATWVPIQSNRGATYGHVAKAFNLLEDNNMTETELKKEESPETEVPKEEVKEEETKAEEPAKEEAPEEKEEEKVEEKKEEEGVPVDEKLEELEAENKKLKEQVEKLSKHAVLKPTTETPSDKKEKDADELINVEKMLRLRYGGNN